MNIFTWLKSRYTWKWIGTVEGPTNIIDNHGNSTPGGDRRCYWVLRERGDGKRSYERIGRNWGSALALTREAEVMAWLDGGPLPTLNIQAESKPAKPKGKATLIVFPGGKGGAA